MAIDLNTVPAGDVDEQNDFVWFNDVSTSPDTIKKISPAVLRTALLGYACPEDYGAKGDTAIGYDGEITSGSPNFSSATAAFTANDVGKTIVVTGAGASGAPLITTILTYTSATAVVLAANAGTTVGAPGKIFYYGTDDTAAFQDALDAAVAAGGGLIQARLKAYLITDKITIPSRDFNSDQVAVVSIKGVVPPMRSNWNDQVGDDAVLQWTGQTIIQMAHISHTLLGVVAGYVATNPTGVQIELENLVFRVPAKYTGTAVDLARVYSCIINKVTIEPSDHQSKLPQPEASSIGIILPVEYNGAQVYVRNLGVAGFYQGLQQWEHADLADIWFYRCYKALISNPTSHAPLWGRLQFIWCPICIESTGSTSYIYNLTDGGLMDIEDGGLGATGGWTAPQLHVNDPNNTLRGTLVYRRVVSGVGSVDDIFVNGAQGLQRRQYGFRTYDSGNELPFANAFNVVSASLPPEENTEQVWRVTCVAAPNFITAEVDSDGAKFNVGGGTLDSFAKLEALTDGNYEIEAKMTTSPTSAYAGLCIKYGGLNNYISAHIEKTASNRLVLFKRDNGAYTDLATSTAVTFALGTQYTLKVRHDSGVITVYINGTLRITHTLSGPDQTKFSPMAQFGLSAYVSAGGAEDGGSFWNDFTAVAV